MSSTHPCFAENYAEARQKFLQAAQTANLPVRSFIAPEQGLQGEELATDVVRQGPKSAQRLLILSCGSQGADGFTGSAVQCHLLHSPQWAQALQATGVAVLYVHGINPWGMSHWAFTDAQNINFMRNFVDFDQPLPDNPNYAAMHEHALKPFWAIEPQIEEVSRRVVEKYGLYALLSIYQKGQYSHPQGLYFGCCGPSWAQQTWRSILRDYARPMQALAWIDFRRGWGVRSGSATLVANVPPEDEAAIARSQQCWADALHPGRVARPDDPETLIPFGTGNPVVSFTQECPNSTLIGLAAYFPASESLQEMSLAARSSHWLYSHPEASAQEREQIHALMRKISIKTDEADWQEAVLTQAQHLAEQGLQGLKPD